MIRVLIFSFLLIAIAGTSCREIFGKRIRGNGHITRQPRQESGFGGVAVSGNIDVYLKTDSTTSVSIETDENLQHYVTTTVSGGILHVRYKKGANPKPSRGVNVYVSAPSLTTLKASGACELNSESRINATEKLHITLSGSSSSKLDVNAPEIEASLSGACTLEIKGETRALLAKGAGSTDIRAFELMAENAHIRISGAGDAEVSASVKLDVKVTGAGSVRYRGNPQVSQHVTGSGSVRRVE